MGCASSTANNKGKDEMGKRKLPVEASTVVKRLIENEFYRDELREFILLRWCPSKCDSQYFRSNAREIALSCLDFWLDSKDFVKINCRIFQEYRACIIFEKYIMHGALQQVSEKLIFTKYSQIDNTNNN